MSFGIPLRNGVAIGLGSVAALAVASGPAPYVPSGDSLLLEQGGYILQESGGSLLIAPSADTALLAHFDNSYADSSGYGYTITPGAKVLFDTNHKYGTHSLMCVTTTGGVTAPIGALGTSDFTAECWYYGAWGLVSFCPLSNGISSSAGYFRVALRNAAGGQIDVTIDGTVRISVPGAATNGVWSHIALTRAGNVWTLWHNGSSIGTWTGTADLTATNWVTGQTEYSAGSDYICLFDELRVTKNVALYTTTFTPTGPFS